jgi:hypothetical protein
MKRKPISESPATKLFRRSSIVGRLICISPDRVNGQNFQIEGADLSINVFLKTMNAHHADWWNPILKMPLKVATAACFKKSILAILRRFTVKRSVQSRHEVFHWKAIRGDLNELTPLGKRRRNNRFDMLHKFLRIVFTKTFYWISTTSIFNN